MSNFFSFLDWEKELITKNYEVFEFLKLEILSTSEISPEAELKIKNKEADVAIAFRILVRQKTPDQTLVCFKVQKTFGI